jgi:hypothetical protein
MPRSQQFSRPWRSQVLLRFQEKNEPEREVDFAGMRVDLIGFSIVEDGTAYVEDHVTARDLTGSVLFDEKVGNVFQNEDGLIRRFDIRK